MGDSPVSFDTATSVQNSGVARGEGLGGSNPPLTNVKKVIEDKIVENTQS